MSQPLPTNIPLIPPFDSDKEQVTEFINQGLSDAQIAYEYGVTKDTIIARRKRWNLPNGSSIAKKNLVESIKVFWVQGYTVKEIANLLHVSTRVVYTKIQNHKIDQLNKLEVDAPNMSLTQLKQGIIDGEVDDTSTIALTYKKIPKWVMLPVQDYKDLMNGNYHSLRQKESE